MSEGKSVSVGIAKPKPTPVNTASLGGVHPAVVDRLKLLAKWPKSDPIDKSFEMKKKFEDFCTEITVFMAPLNADVGRTVAVMDLLRHAKDEAINAVALGQITGASKAAMSD
jgi:hypothetical protein